MFLFILFLVYSSCIFDIVMISNDFMHMIAKHLVQLWIGLGGRYDVSVVLILNLPMNAPYILGHQVVDHGCDIPIESYVAVTPSFPKKTKHSLYVCPGSPHIQQQNRNIKTMFI
jgi:hypothetical protein